jgi:23S rRNA maturation mini-RNase III
VRKILALEARARRLLTRYEGALVRAVRAKAQAHTALDRAQLLEYELTGSQLSELRRARGAAAKTAPAPGASSALPITTPS